MGQKASASPTKEFFVRTIVRDIRLEDCILDLLDNCLDGARRSLERHPSTGKPKFLGFVADLKLTARRFSIEDNCGGISIESASNYAFHFGRRPDAPPEGKFSIGLYGIGMKRALFKIGKDCVVWSSTEDEAFSVKIDVEDWLKKSDWDFDLEVQKPWKPAGTRVVVSDLNADIGSELSDRVFGNRLAAIIGRDYSFFLQQGFAVKINGIPVEAYKFALREGGDHGPIRFVYTDESGVEVEIIAGMAGPPPDDSSPESANRSETDYFGWFVACNDRIVLAADKTEVTGWGDQFPAWHFQYNGFMGIVHFRSPDNPQLLPWTTTKREIDLHSAIYRRALTHMKRVARGYIDYTNARKDDLENAKEMESATIAKPIGELSYRAEVRLPTLSRRPNVEMANISYAVEKSRAQKLAAALGSRFMTNKQIGLKSFEYAYNNEVGEDE